MDWYLEVLRKYATFTGRARRKEYWFFALFNLLIMLVLSFIDGMIGLYSMEAGLGVLSGIYTLAVLIPSLAVTVRRLHDIGRSGWWLLIAFIPLIGALILLIFTVLDSKPGSNQYGPDPKGMDGETLVG
jgi:uncharacterized membrane protein YhaH (DUF805 family)